MPFQSTGLGSTLKGAYDQAKGFITGLDDRKGRWDIDRGDYNLPGYGDMQQQYGGLLGQGPRTAPQAGQSGFRGNQQQLAGMLMGQAQGQGPGQEIARRQAAMQTDRGLGQQLAMARSSRPGGGAMAARNAAMASGQLQGQGAQAASMGGLLAQQQAVGQLGSVLQGARGQDQNLALKNAQLQYETMGLDDVRQMELLRQQLAMNKAQQQGGQAYQGDLGRKFNIEQSQPTGFDRALGLGQGYLQSKLLMGAGGSPAGAGGGSLGYQSGYGNLYGDSSQYSVPSLQSGGSWDQSGGFGGSLGQAPQYGGGFQVDPYSGAKSGYSLPKL